MNVLLMAVMMGLAMFAFHGHGHHGPTREPEHQAPKQQDEATPSLPAHNTPRQPSGTTRDANPDSNSSAESKSPPKVD